jgi:hypothetical protein
VGGAMTAAADPTVDPMSHKCPACNAGPNQPCRTRTSRKAEWPHVRRLRLSTTTSATRAENIRLIRKMFEDVKPEHLTDDEIAAMVEILKAAWDRMQESTRARVVYLDSVRSRPRRRP